MQAWPLSEDEVDRALARRERLRQVHRSGLLEAEADAAFDHVTALAQQLLDVPVAFVAVVDEDSDFYRSQIGFGEPLASERRLTGRTFCHYTLAHGRTLAIPDTHADRPWRDVPTVRSLGVRAYLGVPLRLAGEVIGSLCCVDGSAREWTEAQQRTLNALAQSLERELGLRQAAADAERSNDHLRELMRRNDEEAATIAHDLKAPVSVLNMALKRLDRKLGALGIDDEGVRAIVEQLQGGSSMVRQLADDLRAGLGTAQPRRTALGAPLPRLTRVAAATLLEDARRLGSALAAREGVMLNVSDLGCEAEVEGDPPRLLRALTNLVDNAVKFSPSRSTVWMSCADATLADGRPGVAFVIRDEGQGLDALEQARVFERGFQGDESRRRGDGSGLGLAIVRTIAEAHGGDVTIVSRGRGQGCTATLRLPHAAA